MSIALSTDFYIVCLHLQLHFCKISPAMSSVFLSFTLTEVLCQENEFLVLTCVKSLVQNHVQTQVPGSVLPWGGCSL